MGATQATASTPPRPMRIVYVSPYLPVRDGIADYTAAFVAAVRERGHEARVVSGRPAADAPPEVMGSLPVSRRARAALLDDIRAWDPDVVHVQFAVASYGTRVPALLAFLRAARSLRARVVVTFHEVTRDTESLRALGRAVYSRAARDADVALVHTANARDALVNRAGAPAAAVAVIPHPRRDLPAATVTPDDLRARHGLGTDPVLLAFGFIHVDKGLDDLAEALNALRPEHPRVRLVVAGDVRTRRGAFRAVELRDRLHLRKVRKMLARFGLTDAVVFTGYVDSGEVRPWFELADAAVLPYRRIEQSGVASLAAAADAPVIVSDIGGLAEGLGDRRWAFEPGDPSRLAAVLDEFLSASPAERDGARSRMAEADIDTVVDETLANYARERMRVHA